MRKKKEPLDLSDHWPRWQNYVPKRNDSYKSSGTWDGHASSGSEAHTWYLIVGDRSIIRGYAMRNTTGGKKTASPHCGHFRYVAPWAPLQSVSSRSLQYGQSRAMVIWVEYCCSSSRCSAWMQAYRCGSSALELIFAIITTTSYAVSKSSA